MSKNIKCIDKCKPPRSTIFHPANLVLTANDASFCAISQFKLNPEKKRYDVVQNCNDFTNNIIANFIVPDMEFTPEVFLRVYYNFESYDDVINWLNNNSHTCIDTRIRIIECIWNTFPDDIIIIDEVITNNYIEYFKTKYIKDFFIAFKDFIEISDNKIYFIKKSKEKDSEHVMEKINFIKDKLITSKHVSKFLMKYFKNNDNFMSCVIKDTFIKYLENKLK